MDIKTYRDLHLTEFSELFPPKLADYFTYIQARVGYLEMKVRQLKMFIDGLKNEQEDC